MHLAEPTYHKECMKSCAYIYIPYTYLYQKRKSKLLKVQHLQSFYEFGHVHYFKHCY